MSALEKLKTLREAGGPRVTIGLDDATIERLAKSHADLAAAIDRAAAALPALRESFPDVLALDEIAQCRAVLADFVNFYQDDAVNPYVAIAAQGPWIVTLKGAVVYDAGGYGMLGAGHAPAAVIEAMSRPHVMA